MLFCFSALPKRRLPTAPLRPAGSHTEIPSAHSRVTGVDGRGTGIAAIPACFSFSMSLNAIAPAEFSSPRLSDRVVKLSKMTSLTPVPMRS